MKGEKEKTNSYIYRCTAWTNLSVLVQRKAVTKTSLALFIKFILLYVTVVKREHDAFMFNG